jgi:hypothetical protein
LYVTVTPPASASFAYRQHQQRREIVEADVFLAVEHDRSDGASPIARDHRQRRGGWRTLRVRPADEYEHDGDDAQCSRSQRN